MWADVIATIILISKLVLKGTVYHGRCYCHREYVWLMLLPMADFVARWLMLLPLWALLGGWCCCCQININKFTIIGREDQSLIRAIKEAILIRVNDPSLNRNIGKYHLPHIWDEVLHNTSELKLKHWPVAIPSATWLQHLPTTPRVVTTSTTQQCSNVVTTSATWQ